MRPPENVKLIELRTSTIWIEENGIMCAISKKTRPDTLEETRESIRVFKELFGDQKFCMLIDVTHSTPTSKEVRKYAAEELAKLVKAIAMISNSALGVMIVNLFFHLMPPDYPTKIFTSEEEAKEWLRQYL
jgi:hypothetical protein